MDFQPIHKKLLNPKKKLNNKAKNEGNEFLLQGPKLHHERKATTTFCDN